MREAEMDRIAGWIGEVLGALGDAATEQRIRAEVAELAGEFPIYTRRWQASDSAAGRLSR
jgi:glycine/serine hydroxymethyltransferase